MTDPMNAVDEKNAVPKKKVMHPNSLKNLRAPFQKGEIGNPKGIGGRQSLKKLKPLQEYFEQILTFPISVKMPDGLVEDKTILDQIIMKVVAKAAAGDMRAAELVLERNFGKEDQKLILQMTHEAALKQLKKEEENNT